LTGTIALGSAYTDTKENFFEQELPVPQLGLHLRHSLNNKLAFNADFIAGLLPWVNSMRKEGGAMWISQVQTDTQLGLNYHFNTRWQAKAFVFHSDYLQKEQSHEDTNLIHLHANGLGLSITHHF
jgi:hypothetical protein